MNLYTVSDIMKERGTRRVTVLMLAKHHRKGTKLGSYYVFTQEEFDYLCAIKNFNRSKRHVD